MNFDTTVQKMVRNRLQDIGFLTDKKYTDTDSWRFSRQHLNKLCKKTMKDFWWIPVKNVVSVEA
ncbi:hypothetical protein B9C88_01205 [Brevibacillus laterosporus]|uniref:hypothetical protein n=1 Tax=Brevibacillus laterosporus TaxID=1465 RepID=UPI000BCEA7DD|nr:hypothetical protein [Brevibacillus laterosporus]PCN46161.1 hypothetical protein B9C88_01205 [Brevibacillus laterosporus]